MLNRRDALDLALTVWNDARRVEMPRLERIDAALKPPPMLKHGETAKAAYGAKGFRRPNVVIPDDAPDLMWELARKSETNYLPLLVRTFRQALRVDGYLTTVAEEQNPWRWWQANRMDGRQVGIVDSTLKYGAAYSRVVPGDMPDGTTGPVSRGFTPRTMTAIYADPEVDEWPIASVHIDGPNGEHLVLTDEEAEYRFALMATGATGWRNSFAALSDTPVISLGSRSLGFVEARPHGADMGVTPVVRYRDTLLLDGEETFGIVEPVLVIQERIDETGFGQLVAQYLAAFKQRAVLGWVPESEAEEMKASAARAWYLDVDPNSVAIHEFAETDLTRYIDSGKSARRDFASISQIPAQSLGVDALSNISDATLAGLDKSKNERSGEIALALGEAYEQLLRTYAWVAGDMDAARDYESEIRWAQREARTWAGQVDGLVKLVQARIMSEDTALGMVPGLTDQQVEAARADARKVRAAVTAQAAQIARQAEAAAAAKQQQAEQPPAEQTPGDGAQGADSSQR